MFNCCSGKNLKGTNALSSESKTILIISCIGQIVFFCKRINESSNLTCVFMVIIGFIIIVA
nr:MAG TPA: hypothetical protein [Caudoviricetes sp.]